MKTLMIVILLLVTTLNINAKRTDIYKHAKEMRLNSQNIPERLFFTKRDAQNGDRVAQFKLAIMYASGDIVAKNERIAFNWFHKAALNNHTEAKYYMGLSFVQGRGVKVQLHLARQWFNRALKDGYKKASYHLRKIEKELFS